MPHTYDVIVVGAGLVGLATAHHLRRLRPDATIGVLEANRAVGAEQSRRNSGVVHAGVYYTPGSHKAQLCVAGRKQLHEFCVANGVPYITNGKLIVAVNSTERAALTSLQQRAEANNVPIERLGPNGLRDYEPHVSGVAALYSPSTAITDFGLVAAALAHTLETSGVSIHTSTPVTGFQQRSDAVTVTSDGEVFTAARVVVAAGLHADRLARLSGMALRERIVPFRGSWLTLSDALQDIVTRNIYPVPIGNGLPFLGVHITRRPNGALWVGPNAVLMGQRGGTRRFAVNPRDLRDTVTFPGFWRLAMRHGKTGVGEVARDLNIHLMVRALRRYLPAVTTGDLTPGPFGIRAQLLKANGALIDDFTLRTDRRITHVLNAPSPAATASFAIGEVIARNLTSAA